jgi:hypothetical protein
MSGPTPIPPDKQRLEMMRDLIAVLRDFSNEDFEGATALLEPYRGNPEKQAVLAGELIEVVSLLAETATEAGLPDELLDFLVDRVPAELRPSYQHGVDLIRAVNEGRSAERVDVINDAFIKAMLNIGTWLVQQIANKTGRTEAEIYETTSLMLAAAQEDGT